MNVIGTLSDCPAITGPALVMGASPSLLNFDHASFQGTRIGVGDVPWRAPELGPFDYWVCANNQFPLPWIRRHAFEIKKTDVPQMVYATSMFGQMRMRQVRRALMALRSANDLPRSIVYEQRHLEGVFCTPLDGCCFASRELQVGPPIQQRLQERVPHLPRYSGSSSVVFHGIAFALLLGARPVYIAGVSLPTRALEYTHVHELRTPPLKTRRAELRTQVQRFLAPFLLADKSAPSPFARHREEIVRDLSILAAAGLHLGSQIIATHPEPILQSVLDIRTLES